MTVPTLKVAELFYSPQGEGRRAGEPSIFVRLTGCSAKHACYETGVRCDTEFESGAVMTMEAIEAWIAEHAPTCRWIIWTGGEPTDQLTAAHVAHFKALGMLQAIETSGIRVPPVGLDWVCVSPKVAEHVMAKNWADYRVDVPTVTTDGLGAAITCRYHVHELRYVRHVGQAIPQPALTALHYYLSPHSDGFTINRDNVRHCLELVKAHPQWALSVQQHKIWQVL